MDFRHRACLGGFEFIFHLHRFDDDDRLAGRDRLAMLLTRTLTILPGIGARSRSEGRMAGSRLVAAAYRAPPVHRDTDRHVADPDRQR